MACSALRVALLGLCMAVVAAQQPKFEDLSAEEQAMAKKQQQDLQDMFKLLEGKSDAEAQAVVKAFTPEQQQLLKAYHEYRQQQQGGGAGGPAAGGPPGGGQPSGQPERPPTPQEQQQMLKEIFASLEGKDREEQNKIIDKLPKIQKELLDRYNEYQFEQQKQHMEKEKKRLGFCSDKEVYPKQGRAFDYSKPNLEKCTQLSLWDDELGDAGAQALADAITGHAQFVGLSLDTTGIEAAGAEALAAAIDGSAIFQSMDLEGNSVGNAGAIALAKAAASCPSLQVLNLAHNEVGNEGAEALVALVKKHTGIVQLGFHGNIASKQISNLLKNLVEANAMENFRLAELAKNQTEAAKALEEDGEPIEEVEEEEVAAKDEL